MSFIDKLEKRFGGWTFAHLTTYLILLQMTGVLLLSSGYASVEDLVLVGEKVQAGQWSRLFTFMMLPQTMSPLWLFFGILVFYMIGSGLEHAWGRFRYNLYILGGYVFTLLASFIFEDAVISNIFFLGGIFLAYATLYPEKEFRIYFILPVKVKWLGVLTAGSYLFFLFAPGSYIGTRASIVAAFAIYLLFFGKGIVYSIKARKRKQAYEGKNKVLEATPRHVCAVCGIRDLDDGTMEFRYCSVCKKCFCSAHIKGHTHG